MLRDKYLKEKYEKYTESKNAQPIPEKYKAIFERLLHNQIGYLAENSGTYSGDIATLGAIMVPVFRRAFAQMIGKYLAGLQPMKQSTGHAFALRYHYAGNSAGNGTNLVKGGGNSGFTPLSGNWTPTDTQRNAQNSLLLVWDTAAARALDAPDVSYGEAPVNGIGDFASGITQCSIIYTESNKAVVRTRGTGTIAGIKAVKDVSGSGVSEWYDNEAGYLHILKNYSGPLSTLVGEQLGNDMQELGLTIDKIGIEAVTRKLKARWTTEAAQDLKAAHGKDMQTEMIDILTYEITQALDRDILDAINSVATVTSYDAASTGSGGDSDGRWQLERFRTVYTEIIRKANDIARTTLRGPGNQIVGTPDVCTVLEQMQGFTGIAPVAGTVNTNEPIDASSSAFIGTLGGRFNIYRDIFNGVNGTGNYATILWKGASSYDAPVIWSPYVPLEMKQLVDQESGNPSIIFYERSAISNNIFGSDQYVRKINFSNLF